METMSIRQTGHQPDLLRQATINAEGDKLAPEARTTLIALLKQLLTECISAEMGKSSDE
jgi:hypothetical protein